MHFMPFGQKLSSLQVMSGLRFVRAARARDIPIVIVNRGRTRGDDLATLKVDAGCAETLADWATPMLSIRRPQGYVSSARPPASSR